MVNPTHLLHRPKWLVVIVGILMFWLSQTAWLTDSELWGKADGALIDRRYLLRGQDLPDPRIKIIGLNTTSFQLDSLSPAEIAASPTLQKMQQPWPWDRSVYAAILEKLMDAGAKVVVFDFVFASETDGDFGFARDLQKYHDRVAIGSMFGDGQGVETKSKQLTTPNARLLLPGTESIVGLVNLWTDEDGVFRQMRYRTSGDRENLEIPGTDPRIIRFLRKKIAAGQSPDDLTHITALAAEKFQGKIFTPPPDKKTFVNFQGPAGTYRAWPVENMFVDELWQGAPFNGGSSLSNKIVIVGPMAEIFHDIHAAPFGETPGPEIQAQMLAALLQNEWLRGTSATTNLCLTLAAVALALVICLAIPQALLKSFLLVGITVAFLVGCQLAFTHGNLVVSMMPPLFCLVTTGSFGIIFEYTLEQLERRRYRSLLYRYVSKNIAKTILADRRSFVESLKGRKQPVTVLFSDIRGFTTMTESTDADKLVAQLNEYFADMVGSVDTNNGTLQKFIGDAIMAVWGDTCSAGVATDAQRAITAALQMRAALEKLNLRWKDNADRQKLSIGIGINHGEVIVGNIGHSERTEFTVLGDGVNLAARLESATKQFHTDILIGEEAEKLTREHFIFRSVGAIAFKGKTRPIETFQLISDRSSPPPRWLEPYHQAVRFYRERQFAAAIELFEKVQLEIGREDYLCDMYLLRCLALKESQIAEHWDGAFTLAEK